MKKLTFSPKKMSFTITNTIARKPSIILDLDATLIQSTISNDDLQTFLTNVTTNAQNQYIPYRSNRKDLTKPIEFNVHSFHYYKKQSHTVQYDLHVVLRRHLKEFIDFCFEHFEYIFLYSAGQRIYVEDCVRIIFSDPNRQPKVVMCLEDCQVTKDNTIQKPILKFLSDPRIVPLQLQMNQIWIVDDWEFTFSANPTQNGAIHIPAFQIFPERKLPSDYSVFDINDHDDHREHIIVLNEYDVYQQYDHALLQLMDWFHHLFTFQTEHPIAKEQIFNISHETYLEIFNHFMSKRNSTNTTSNQQHDDDDDDNHNEPVFDTTPPFQEVKLSYTHKNLEIQ